MAQATPKVGYNIPAGLRPIEFHRPNRDGCVTESTCARPPITGAETNAPRELADFGPALELDGNASVVGKWSGYNPYPIACAGSHFIDGNVIHGVECGIDRAGSSTFRDDLTDFDLDNLNSILDHELAQNTMNNYAGQWRSFLIWALGRGIQALPASPAQVAAYLAERIEEQGHKPATLRMAASAIAFVHKTAGMNNPCASPDVRRTLKSATRKVGRLQKQAEALTAEALAAIRTTACKPRRGRGGKLESQETATNRGNLDIALIGLMRDAMLRVSEVSALTWKDLAVEPDGTGRLLIRRSKSDPEGMGAAAFVSAQTMAMLRLVRNGKGSDDSVFGLRPNQISRRIKLAAKAAGLGEGFSGHSPRVGMARDLARTGIELPSLMNAGRWRSPTMPAHYTRNETAGKGAVAQFHGYFRQRG